MSFFFMTEKKESESEVSHSNSERLHGLEPTRLCPSRQGYWSGLLFPSPGNLTDPGIEPGSATLQADTLPSEPPGKPNGHEFEQTPGDGEV